MIQSYLKKEALLQLGGGVGRRRAWYLAIGSIFFPPGPEDSSFFPVDGEGRGAAQVGATAPMRCAADHQLYTFWEHPSKRNQLDSLSHNL